MGDKVDPLLELAVWGNLDRFSDYSLILLNGHVFLEKIIEIALKRMGDPDPEKLSFYSKVIRLKHLLGQSPHSDSIIYSLTELNRLRNKLAHEFKYDAKNGEFHSWSEHIHLNFEGEKYTKFTQRTKIVHAFSFLAINILEASNQE
ncbi:hypothetical protein SAMN04489724_1744 [Algoriphagus locisalis]|uniref:Mannitol repressor n=1 Tax=Algoriphagus locisalis TaxID=305507 RepID=A0A1I7A801_9BACT|nr:hypothetical protein [Algoriphagus locisalis]SFT71063.1 hypothetical protein SAMN04489724_1744 [Algoriphagus locisalis]